MIMPKDYYADERVRARIYEYMKGARYMVAYGESLLHHGAQEPFMSATRDRLHWAMDCSMDLFRSNWDSYGTLGMLDVEYFNLDYPAEIFYRQQETFEKLEPIYHSALRVFYKFGIDPVCLMTGQGYHFSFRVPYNTPTHKALEALGRIPESVRGKYSSVTKKRTRVVTPEEGNGFDGMGRLMEYFGHQLIKEARRKTDIPLTITDLAIGPRAPAQPGGKRGPREAIDIDLSMYGDPVFMRDIRCAFSSYQKHKVLKWKFGEVGNNVPIMITPVRREPSRLRDLLPLRRHLRNAAEYASTVSAKIPDGTAGTEALIFAYKRSQLAKFHQQFDELDADSPQKWPSGYDCLELDKLPGCAAAPLVKPNDLLLKPTNIQTVVRVLLRRGWHPKHIAGLVQSKFERDHGWGGAWTRYDACSRAYFYVRMLAGMLCDDTDEEIDLNCVSQKEKGHCYNPNCGFNLKDFTLDRYRHKT